MRVSVCVLVCMLSVCSALICPDGGMCEDGNTCCQTPGGAYGCCPLPNAKCCLDHLHCCHEGTMCDIEHGTCVNKTHTLEWVRRVGSKQITRVQAVVCPDQESECPDGTTCCQMPDGNWGCCPMPNAVCCDDKRHCCPEGTTCDLPHSKCVSAVRGSTPLLKKFPAIRKVICPDKVSTCQDNATCCKLTSGSYGCCPMPNAVCCEDHIHCCPEDTTCDLEHDTCVVANELPEMNVEATPILLLKPTVNSVPCNDSMACATGSTCCKKPDGEWACCPLQQAVCCADHLHCCPHDSVCNMAAGTCDGVSNASGRLTVPWVSKTPAVALVPENESCDETWVCPTGTTCCKQKSGTWACCLLPQAVCCEDQEHCCPQGYKCDVAHESCEHPFLPSMLWVRNQPAQSVMHSFDAKMESGSQKCDARTSCPRGSTCCYMAKFSKWGCCPLPQAVCCGDGDHCCPNGYTCDKEKPVCVKGQLQIPWFEKKSAASALGSEVTSRLRDVQCDDTTSCAAGTTCCKQRTGNWGCCPLAQAVCCEDHEHCCPHDYTCDLSSGTCVKPYTTHTVALTLIHTLSDHDDDGEVMCDATRRCLKSQTCCRVSDAECGCCPFQQAVCCKDTKHCCPKGYTCDPEKRCTKASPLTWWDNSL